MRFFLRYILIFQVLFFTAVPFYAENFRVRKVHLVQLEEKNDFEEKVTVGINDSICIFLPAKEAEKYNFMEGIEVKVQIPKSVSDWRDSVALSIYENVSPKPSDKNIDYSGSRLFIQPLPSKMTWICQIPFYKETSIKDSSYTTKVGIIPDISSNFAFIRFMPVMKGVPEETLNASLSVSIKPCLKKIGRPKLNFERGDDFKNSPFDIYMDDNLLASQVRDDKYILFAEPGIHNISIQSEEFRSEVRSTLVNMASTTEEKFLFKSLKPLLKISAFDNAEIFFDEEAFTNIDREFEVSEGEHSIRFNLGNYEILRNIKCEKGKSYTVNLNVDLQILEE